MIQVSEIQMSILTNTVFFTNLTKARDTLCFMYKNTGHALRLCFEIPSG